MGIDIIHMATTIFIRLLRWQLGVIYRFTRIKDLYDRIKNSKITI